jgi:hypothetical protein
MCKDTVERYKVHKYRWIGNIKNNRIVFYQNEQINLWELYDLLRAEGRFVDVMVNGEFYSACKVNVYVSEVGEVGVLINVKVGTRDVHFLCSDLVELSVFELVELVFRCCVIEGVHK